MSAKQPEALRLAEQLENLPYQLYDLPEPKLAAATLRTQHALLKRATDALFVWQNSDGWVWPETARKTANERTAELLIAITQHLEPK